MRMVRRPLPVGASGDPHEAPRDAGAGGGAGGRRGEGAPNHGLTS